MPIDETSTPGVTPNNDNQSTSPTGAISDLGDILMDKTVENIEKNDFVPVSKNDVAALDTTVSEQDSEDPFSKPSTTSQDIITPVENHATVEDLQSIMLDIPQTNASPFGDSVGEVVGKEETSAETVDEVVVEQNSETISTPDGSDNILDINLDDISLPQDNSSSEATIDIPTPIIDNVSVEESTQVIDSPIETVDANVGAQTDMTIDLSTITTESLQQESPTGQETIDMPSAPTIDTSSVEESAITVGETHNEGIDTIQSTDSTLTNQQPSETSDISVSQDVVIPPSQNISTPVETLLNEPVVPENTVLPTGDISNSPDVQQKTNIDSASLDKIADDITQGIDLDSLVADGIPPAVPIQQQPNSDIPLTTQTPAEGIKAIAGATTAKQKKLLIILGSLVLIGVVYFAIQTFNTSSVPTPTPVAPVPTESDTTTQTTPQEEVETTGTVNEQLGMTGEIILGSGEITEPPIEEPTVAPKTRDQLLTEAKGIDGGIRKALIKATIMKNTSVRGDAFQLQKDLQTYIQTLENTNDITTLSDSEKQLETLSQRLDTILTSLNGSNQ